MSAAPAPIPRPRVLHIDPDDRPIPHCLRRLDAPIGEYVVDLTQPDGEAA